jgi:hypothetical protein
MVHQNAFWRAREIFPARNSVGGSGKRGRFQGVLMGCIRHAFFQCLRPVPIANILPGRFKFSLCSSVRRHLDCVTMVRCLTASFFLSQYGKLVSDLRLSITTVVRRSINCQVFVSAVRQLIFAAQKVRVALKKHKPRADCGISQAICDVQLTAYRGLDSYCGRAS